MHDNGAAAAYRRRGLGYDYPGEEYRDGEYYLLPAEDTLHAAGEGRRKAGGGHSSWRLIWVSAVALAVGFIAKSYMDRVDGSEAPSSLPSQGGGNASGKTFVDSFSQTSSPSALGELNYTATDERREFPSRGPLVPLEGSSPEPDPSTRPCTVPFALGYRQEDLPLDPSGLPKAWVPRKAGGSEGSDNGSGGAEGTSSVLSWLTGADSADQEGGSGSDEVSEGASKPRELPSSDAFSMARQLDLSLAEAGESLPLEDAKSALRRRFSRVLQKIGSGQADVFLQTVAEASRLPSTGWDARSRALRAELLLAEITNDVVRLQEREVKLLVELVRPEAGETREELKAEYLSLLREEQTLLMDLEDHIKLWKAEVDEVLMNVASVLTSTSFKDVEALGTCQSGLMGISKATVKLTALGTSLPKETRSKTKAIHVGPLVQVRLEEINFRIQNVDKLNTPEVVAAIGQYKERAKTVREESRKTLLKKKAATWFVDTF